MNNNNLLTFIIPVFNGINTLQRCVDSLEKTVHREQFSIIIADDGSTDGSIDLEYNLKNQYSNIDLLKLSHGGVVQARKKGLEIASGEYIWFIDADDYVIDSATDKILEIIRTRNNDIIAFSHIIKNSKKENIMSQILKPGSYNRKRIEDSILPYVFHDFREKSFRKPILDGFLWNKVFKKDLIIQNICNDSNISLFEDVLSIAAAIYNANSLYCIPDPLYVYVKEDSVTTKYRDDYFFNTYLCKEYLNKWITGLPGEWNTRLEDGCNAFIVERLIVSITREIRFKASITKAKPFVKNELKKYPIVKDLKFKKLPFTIRCYLLMLKLHLYTFALMISKMMA